MFNNVTNSFPLVPLKHASSFYFTVLSSSVMIAILSPVAVVGNSLVLAAIWRNPSLRTPSYILLAGLAFTDFCTGLITEPFYVANSIILLENPRLLMPYNWPMSYRITTIVSSSCAKYFYQVTLLILTFMSVERWLHMSRRYLITVRRACFIVALLFFITIVLVLIGSGLASELVYYSTNISLLLVCLIVTSVAYFKVFQIIRHHQQQIQANELSQNFAHPAINFEKYKKSIFSILCILTVFYLGYLPLFVSMGLLVVLTNEFSVIFLAVSTSFVFLASSLNPLLYLWRMKDVRIEVKQLVKQILCKNS